MFWLGTILALFVITHHPRHFVGAVRLSQETPCLLNGTCLLQCVLDSGSGTPFYSRDEARSEAIVGCQKETCNAFSPSDYRYTKVSNSVSSLEILRFQPADADFWSCSDGPNAGVTFIQVDINSLPVGPLTFGAPPCPAVSPANLTCSLPTRGDPPATLTLIDSSNQTVASSQTGSVTGTVTRGGQASCSVTWPKFPSFQLNISHVQCTVQVAAKAVITSVPAGSSVRVTCEAYGGFPAASVFGDWTHAWGGRVLRTFPAQPQGNQATLTLTSFQDTGTYTCSVSNNVDGFKSNSTNVVVEDFPQLLLSSDLTVQAAEVSQSVLLFSPLYAVPNITSHTWSFNSSPIREASGGFQTGLSPATVSLPVHGVSVSAAGLNASLAFRFQPHLAGSYSLEACNTLGCRAVNITLQETGPPHAPLITGATATSDSVTLTWEPGFAGGDFSQWFLLKYRRQDGGQERGVDEARQQNRNSSDRTPVRVRVAGLDPDTSYVFSLQAQSSRRDNNLSGFVQQTVTTQTGSSLVGPIVGGIFGGLGGCALIVGGIVFVKYRKKQGAKSDASRSLTKRDFADINHPRNEGKVNPAHGEKDDGPSGVQHSSHPIFDDVESNATPPVYAVVDKQAKGKKPNDKQPKSGATSKSREKPKAKSQDKTATSSKGPASENPVREVHEDGTVYVTVEGGAAFAAGSGPKATKQPRNTTPATSKMDEPVIYTTIDHSKKPTE